MAGVKALSKLLTGVEGTKGVAVPATSYWRGMGTGEDLREVVFAEEDVGILGGVDRVYTPKLGAKVTFDETEATFEQLPYILEAGVASQSPVQDGAGTLYINTYTMPTTTQGTHRTFTLEYGDDNQEEESEYCFVKEFSLKGKAGESLMVEAEWMGRQVTPSTFTGSLTLPTVEEVLFSRGKLYIDPVSTFPATTQKTSTFLEMELKVTTGLVEVFTGDGDLYFTFVKRVAPEIVLDITYEHDATAVAEKAAWRAETPRSIRVDFTGSAGSGTTYSAKHFIVDLLGKWEKFEALSESDGNSVVKGTFRARYNGTAANFAVFRVINLNATLA